MEHNIGGIGGGISSCNKEDIEFSDEIVNGEFLWVSLIFLTEEITRVQSGEDVFIGLLVVFYFLYFSFNGILRNLAHKLHSLSQLSALLR